MLPGKKYTPADFVMMARRRVVIILVPFVLGLYAALVVSSLRHDQYQAEMLIQVEPQRVPDSYVHSTIITRTEDRLNALTQQMQSRSILEGVVKELRLYPEDVERVPMQDLVDRMRRNIKVEAVLKSIGAVRDVDSFYVRFTYPDRQVAASVTTRLGDLFIELNREDRGEVAQGTDKFLSEQLEETKKKLEAQEAKLERFRQQNAGKLPNQVDFNMESMRTANIQIQALTDWMSHAKEQKTSLAQRLAEAEATERTRAASRVAGLEPSQTGGPSLQQQLDAARADLASKAGLTREFPAVATATKKVERLEKQLAAATSAAPAPTPSASVVVAETPEDTARRENIASMKVDIASLDRQITQKEADELKKRQELNDYSQKISAVPGLDTEWSALTRDYDTQYAAYKELLTKRENSNLSLQLERQQNGEQFKVLDPARPPLRPAGIPRIVINAAGAVVGFFIGLVLAAILEIRDTTFSCGDDIFEVLQLPVVALVPYVVTEPDRRKTRHQQILKSAAAAAISVAGAYGVWALELWKHVVY